jgi:hypothetical protein
MATTLEPKTEEREEPEFQDEPPGAVLFEMRPRPALVVWGGVDLAATLGLGALGLAASPASLGEGRFPLALLWVFLPISALLGLLVTTFIWLNLPPGKGPQPLARWASGLQLVALLAWALLRFWAGASF